MTIPSISSLGIGSGIDANSLVTKLMALERIPIDQLNQREASVKAKISAFGSLTTRFDALQTAAENIGSASKLAAYTSTVGDTDIASASAGPLAGPGSYSLNVTQLAQAQKSFSGLYGSSDTFAAGTLTFTIGGSDVDVSFGGGSIHDLRSAINSANIGVTATTVTGDGGTRLVLTAKETGTDSAFSLAVSGGDANLQNLASFDAGHASARTAQNAIVEIEGETITSQSNTITGAIPDVTITARAQGATTIEVARDTSGMMDKVKAFVTAYNDAAKELRSASAYNSSTKNAGPLNGDATVRSLQGLMRNAVGNVPGSLSGTPYETLSSLGISFQSDGTLALDESKLSNAIDTDFDSAMNTLNTYGTAMASLAEQVTAFDGLLAGRTDGLNATVDRMADQRTAMEYRLTLTEKRLRSQFTALDTLVGQLNSTSSFLTQQLSSLAALRNN
ncbi:MAG: flagellar filament capping protein FliD [Rhodocyclaceae bacterium]|jgi:flagellar hook-associated protein 2|nr:flagellar filament capping protein FliD [Rhodocyclaceae bacterium]